MVSEFDWTGRSLLRQYLIPGFAGFTRRCAGNALSAILSTCNARAMSDQYCNSSIRSAARTANDALSMLHPPDE